MGRHFLLPQIFLTIMISCGLADLAIAQAPAGPPSADILAQGRTLFNAHCAVCHQASGAGGIHFGQAVSADLQAPGLETTYHNDDQLILRAILFARDENGDRLDAPMPAWNGRLSPAQAKDIIAYLHRLHG